MLVRLLGSEVIQRPHVLQVERDSQSGQPQRLAWGFFMSKLLRGIKPTTTVTLVLMCCEAEQNKGLKLAAPQTTKK